MFRRCRAVLCLGTTFLESQSFVIACETRANQPHPVVTGISGPTELPLVRLGPSEVDVFQQAAANGLRTKPAVFVPVEGLLMSYPCPHPKVGGLAHTETFATRADAIRQRYGESTPVRWVHPEAKSFLRSLDQAGHPLCFVGSITFSSACAVGLLQAFMEGHWRHYWKWCPWEYAYAYHVRERKGAPHVSASMEPGSSCVIRANDMPLPPAKLMPQPTVVDAGMALNTGAITTDDALSAEIDKATVAMHALRRRIEAQVEQPWSDNHIALAHLTSDVQVPPPLDNAATQKGGDDAEDAESTGLLMDLKSMKFETEPAVAPIKKAHRQKKSTPAKRRGATKSTKGRAAPRKGTTAKRASSKPTAARRSAKRPSVLQKAGRKKVRTAKKKSSKKFTKRRTVAGTKRRRSTKARSSTPRRSAAKKNAKPRRHAKKKKPTTKKPTKK